MEGFGYAAEAGRRLKLKTKIGWASADSQSRIASPGRRRINQPRWITIIVRSSARGCTPLKVRASSRHAAANA
jgi:hypothetical protein